MVRRLCVRRWGSDGEGQLLWRRISARDGAWNYNEVDLGGEGDGGDEGEKGVEIIVDFVGGQSYFSSGISRAWRSMGRFIIMGAAVW
jgi:hypothetical protein